MKIHRSTVEFHGKKAAFIGDDGVKRLTGHSIRAHVAISQVIVSYRAKLETKVGSIRALATICPEIFMSGSPY
jgi:hypothetical protein